MTKTKLDIKREILEQIKQMEMQRDQLKDDIDDAYKRYDALIEEDELCESVR